MSKVEIILGELKNISKYSPIYLLKQMEFRQELETAYANGEIDDDTCKEYKKKYLEKDDFSFSTFDLYSICSADNFVLSNFDMSNFLESRKQLYKFIQNLKHNQVTFEKGFNDLLFKLNNTAEEQQELFWDSFFILITCIYLNADKLQNGLLYDNRLPILKVIKYAAELEGKLVNGAANDKMKLFADISPEIGKDIAAKFHLIKAAFTNKKAIKEMLWSIIESNPTYKKQQRMMQMLFSNQCRLQNTYSVYDLIELFFNNEILQHNLWLIEDKKQEVLNQLISYAYNLIDYNVYSFLVFIILHEQRVDGEQIKSRTDKKAFYEKLDKYNVEYYQI